MAVAVKFNRLFILINLLWFIHQLLLEMYAVPVLARCPRVGHGQKIDSQEIDLPPAATLRIINSLKSNHSLLEPRQGCPGIRTGHPFCYHPY